MKKIIRDNLFVFFAYFLIWLLLDFIDVKWQRLPEFKYHIQLIIALVFLSFIWANRSLSQKLGLLLRILIIALTSSVITALWFVITTSVLLQFHLAIGGHL